MYSDAVSRVELIGKIIYWMEAAVAVDAKNPLAEIGRSVSSPSLVQTSENT
jgi:hypothetical protein